MAKHYIGMNGLRGYMPDSCNSYETEQDAVDSLTALLELTDEQAQELEERGIVDCTPEQGAEYCSVDECDCSEPECHND